MSGSNLITQPGVYGTRGVAAATNAPGARFSYACEKDATGNFWLFGGYGYASTGTLNFLNDCWKYNPSTNQWTWVTGDNTVSNLSVYGTKGTAAAANKPGGRGGVSASFDAAGNFWVFGGNGYDATTGFDMLNDLWKYDPVADQWTWMSGDNAIRGAAVYGTKGVPDAANKPGARYRYNMRFNHSGNLQLFGGASAYAGTVFNDLWLYNPSSGQWTWIGGSNTTGSAGVYGTQGVADAANVPGARTKPADWIDAAGNWWLFGGGSNYTPSSMFSDLWMLAPLTPLPVRQINLHGASLNAINQLTWQTTGEENTARFIIEKSTTGATYTAIGTVAAIGSGNNRYTFTDQGTAGVTCFYRIQIVDVNGSVNYSLVVTLNNTVVTNTKVYPNPATNGITLELSNNGLLATTAKIYTAAGQLVQEVPVRKSKQYINLQRCPKGMLTIRLYNGEAVSFIKQ